MVGAKYSTYLVAFKRKPEFPMVYDSPGITYTILRGQRYDPPGTNFAVSRYAVLYP
jgi:hypothetical protein